MILFGDVVHILIYHPLSYPLISLFVSRLALNTMTIQVSSVNVSSGQGVAISVTGIAQVYNFIDRQIN